MKVYKVCGSIIKLKVNALKQNVMYNQVQAVYDFLVYKQLVPPHKDFHAGREHDEI